MHLIVFFDYTCSYSFTAAAWLRRIELREPDLTTEWRPFVLKEAQRRPGDGIPFWDQPDVSRTRTGLAFLAGQAAARQGPQAYERFRFALQAAFHVDHQDIRAPGVLATLAAETGLDVARFNADRERPGLPREVGETHQEAVARYSVFGTPTLVFPNGRAVFLKLASAPADGQADRVFALVRELIEQHPAVQELKQTAREHP